MLEEVFVHERVVALGVVHREVHVLVHIESNNVLEGDTSILVSLNKSLVNTDRRRTGGETYQITPTNLQKPKTKGLSGVGLNLLIRSIT